MYDIPSKSIFVIPHGKYSVDHKKTQDLICSYRQNKKNMRLTMLGELREYKNTEWAADFLCNLNKTLESNQYIELRIAGKPVSQNQSDYLQRLAESNTCLSLNLKRLSDDELLHEFSMADFIFAPYSKLLTSGICINSISHGRPFIAPNFPSLAELHREGGSLLYDNHEDLITILLKNNDFFHRGLLKFLFDPQQIITQSHDLEWKNIFHSLDASPFIQVV